MKALISMVFAVLLMVAPVKADMNPERGGRRVRLSARLFP